MNKFYMIPNSKDLNKFKEELILPLEGYSIGYDTYFNVQEIIEISKNRVVNVVINKFLHKEALKSVKEEIGKLSCVNFFFCEDLGLANIIDRKRVVIFQNHIVNNYSSVNYFSSIGLNNIVISNELVIEELKEIRDKTSSNLFYFLINRNALMYSKRGLISCFYDYKGKKDGERNKEIIENVSKKHLIIKEEAGSTIIFDKNIFSANPYINEFDGFNFIVNFSNLNDGETKHVLEHYKDENLGNYISIENYFLLNKIGYKVGDKR